MKHICLLGLAVSLCTIVGGQSVFTDIVSESNQWQFKGQFGVGSNYTVRTECHFFEGDTTIEGIEYSILKGFAIDSAFTSTGGPDPTTVEVDTTVFSSIQSIGYMRQVNEEVRYYHPFWGDVLYMDQSVYIGQPLIYMNTNHGLIETVTQIPFGNQVIRAYYIAGVTNPICYSGIGGYNGIMETGEIGVEGGSYMNCFSNGSSSINIGLSSQWFGCSEFVCSPSITTNLSIPEIEELTIQSLSGFIEISHNESRELDIFLLDCQGRHVLSTRISDNESRIPTSTLSAGAYIVIVRSENSFSRSTVFVD